MLAKYSNKKFNFKTAKLAKAADITTFCCYILF